jgi:acyl carrier protein
LLTPIEKLELIFEAILPSEINVRKRTRLNCSAWDSLQQLNLILAIEQEFDVALNDVDVQELESFDIAVAILSEHGVAI